jgi:hypothetical protein
MSGVTPARVSSGAPNQRDGVSEDGEERICGGGSGALLGGGGVDPAERTLLRVEGDERDVWRCGPGRK